eukprot:3266393-Pleurochrysis_carterae.AAC.1
MALQQNYEYYASIKSSYLKLRAIPSCASMVLQHNYYYGTKYQEVKILEALRFTDSHRGSVLRAALLSKYAASLRSSALPPPCKLAPSPRIRPL